jgi:hypothetical protein
MVAHLDHTGQDLRTIWATPGQLAIDRTKSASAWIGLVSAASSRLSFTAGM